MTKCWLAYGEGKVLVHGCRECRPTYPLWKSLWISLKKPEEMYMRLFFLGFVYLCIACCCEFLLWCPFAVKRGFFDGEW